MSNKHQTTALPQFQIKATNSDFVVNEIYLDPELASKEAAEYTYVFIEKENLTTFALLEHVARYFRLKLSDVSASGLKDEQAVTRQLISIRAVISQEQVEQANQEFLNEGLTLSIQRMIGYGQKPVSPRKLHGNKFVITIRNLNEEVAEGLEELLRNNRYFSFINYYDEQRFGLPDSIHNTPLIGKALLENDWSKGYHEYLKSGIEQVEIAHAKSAFAKHQSYQKAMLSVARAKLSFFVSSYNSFLWNNRLKEEILQRKDALKVTFPFIGPIALPRTEAVSIPFLLSIKVRKKDWQTEASYDSNKTRPTVITVPVYLLGISVDELNNDGKQAAAITFCLPTGCYATMLVKQLLLAAVQDKKQRA